jgi:hypothetical protein
MAGPEGRLWDLVIKLRRRRFLLGPDDYDALRQALRAGFGWSSPRALCDLCCALWAKSSREREIVTALFDQLDLQDWELPESWTGPEDPAVEDAPDRTGVTSPIEVEDDVEDLAPEEIPTGVEDPPTTSAQGRLPPIRLDGVAPVQRRFVLLPEYPLTYREVAQACRRLRRPTRQGPPSELDVEATAAQWCRQGVAGRVMLRPPRRNTARLLLLVDRQGSMVPFHGFVEEVCDAILNAGQLEHAALFYFHDVPAEGTDAGVLAPVADQLFPALDPVLPAIAPLEQGRLYEDKDLHQPAPLAEILREHASGSIVVLLGDAGAARGSYDALRLLDTVAFLKALRAYTPRFAWLNPLPRHYWVRTTCAQIARHVPMFPLDRDGIHQAVNVLRGQVYPIESPL